MSRMETPASNHRARLLIVDDEEMVLSSIRSLLRIETDYQIDCYTNPCQALDRAKETEPDLVIADYLMPDMNGILFLTHIKESHPEATRILLTGYADKESAIQAINQVGLFQYIEKPWDNSQLLLILRNGLEKRFLVQHLREKILELDEAHTDLKEVQKRLLKAFI